MLLCYPEFSLEDSEIDSSLTEEFSSAIGRLKTLKLVSLFTKACSLIFLDSLRKLTNIYVKKLAG